MLFDPELGKKRIRRKRRTAAQIEADKAAKALQKAANKTAKETAAKEARRLKEAAAKEARSAKVAAQRKEDQEDAEQRKVKFTLVEYQIIVGWLEIRRILKR